MSKKRDPVDENGDEHSVTFSLQELQSHASKVEQNIAESESNEARLAAMVEHGLVDPSENKSAAKSTKVDTKATAALEKQVKELTEQLEESNIKIGDLEASVKERDEQIARLTAALENKADETNGDQSSEEKPAIPPVPAGVKAPWDSEKKD